LLTELSGLGIAPSDVGTVALSHVHDDHVGGLLGADGAPAFPNARHIVQRADIEWLRKLAAESDEDRAVWGLLAPLEDAGVLDPIEGDHRLVDGVELCPATHPDTGLRVVAGAATHDRADTWNHPAQLRTRVAERSRRRPRGRSGRVVCCGGNSPSSDDRRADPPRGAVRHHRRTRRGARLASGLSRPGRLDPITAAATTAGGGV
jgi:glyoxylase-like metal-dependent hydrolase (beta-lactamase superfamily II)